MRDRPTDQHRRVMQKILGRALLASEVVHHKNEAKDQNGADNLEVQTRAQHTAQHNRTRPLSRLRSSLRATKEGRKLY